MKVHVETTMGRIAAEAGGRLACGNPDTPVNTITTDSRQLGENNCFIPIVGQLHDGHVFVEPMVKKGECAGFLTQRESDVPLADDAGVAAVLCDDTLAAYGRLAASRRNAYNPVVIGVTGTNGKTTTKECLAAMLQSRFTCLKNEKNYNNEIGVPFTLLHLQPDHEYAVIELGMNHSGEIRRLSVIAKPDCAIITSIGEGHVEFLGSTENVAAAKAEVLDGMPVDGTLFLNGDTLHAEKIASRAAEKGIRIITFGLGKSADVYPDSYSLKEDSCSIVFRSVELSLPLFGLHNVYNLIAAAAAAEWAGVSAVEMAAGLKNFQPVDMRSRIIHADCTIIDDTYNSNPLSSRYGLMSIRMVFPGSRKIAVFSDMKELGEQSIRMHMEVGGETFKNDFDILCVWGEDAPYIAQGAVQAGMAPENALVFETKQLLIEYLRKTCSGNDVVLVKGSRSMKMEEVVNQLVH